jgi:hypothetical protein
MGFSFAAIRVDAQAYFHQGHFGGEVTDMHMRISFG